MSVTLTSPAAGLDRGATYAGPLEGWLVAYGYATSEEPVADVVAAKDPTLAQNRELPGATQPKLKGRRVTTKDPLAPAENGEREVTQERAPNVPLVGTTQR